MSPAGAEAGPLDAARAWELLLALAQWPERLADAGLTVEPSGAWRCDRPVDAGAAELLDLYLGFALAGPERPMTVGHLGQSLDGHIATADGGSHYVTGRENIAHLHRMRALADAVIVGVGTIEADDPRLTVRVVPGPDPVRVVIDPVGRISTDRRVMDDTSEGTGGTLLVTGRDSVAPAGYRVIRLPANGESGMDPRAIVAELRARNLRALFVEGGGVTVSRFLAAGALDRLQLAIAPVLIGGGRAGLSLPALADLADAPRPPARRFFMGEDVLFDCDLSGLGPIPQVMPEDRGGRF